MIFIGTVNDQSNNDENTDESVLLMSFVLIELPLTQNAHTDLFLKRVSKTCICAGLFSDVYTFGALVSIYSGIYPK